MTDSVTILNYRMALRGWRTNAALKRTLNAVKKLSTTNPKEPSHDQDRQED